VRARPKSTEATQLSPSPAVGPTPAVLAHWETRVLRLPYTSHARPGSENELFARINLYGQGAFFPLESHLPKKAAQRAWEIYCTLADSGWNAVRQRYVRQIVWAIYWFNEPLACTYATLFTIPGHKPDMAGSQAAKDKSGKVALVEPEPEVLGSLEKCLNHIPGCQVVQSVSSAKELLQRPATRRNQPFLVLFNQCSLDPAADAFQRQLQIQWPGVIALPFRIFGYSDEIYMNMTGMDRGYFLRRRLPTQILEPLANLWQNKRITAAELSSHLRSYFQKLLQEENPSVILTQREIEVLGLLGAGHTDKSISSLLGISVWTVHAHVKSIFKKFDVHTRAEAVMRHLQK